MREGGREGEIVGGTEKGGVGARWGERQRGKGRHLQDEVVEAGGQPRRLDVGVDLYA